MFSDSGFNLGRTCRSHEIRISPLFDVRHWYVLQDDSVFVDVHRAKSPLFTPNSSRIALGIVMRPLLLRRATTWSFLPSAFPTTEFV